MSEAATERVALFLDGANVSETARLLGFQIDYQKLKNLYRGADVFYYMAVKTGEDGSRARDFISRLKSYDITVIEKPMKKITTNDQIIFKGNMDGEMTVDMMDKFSCYEHFVLFSGDSDFCAVVNHLRKKGRRVTVISSNTTNPPALSSELRAAAGVTPNRYVGLSTIRRQIELVREQEVA